MYGVELNKIVRDIDRFDEGNKKLNAMGWTVLRFWGEDIKKYLNECVQTVEDAIFENMIEVQEENPDYDQLFCS